MRFALSDEQRSFGTALDRLLGASDVPKVHRAWAAGDTAPGLALWSRIAEAGVSALCVPGDLGGTGGTSLDIAVAFERLGAHAVPGPWIETVVLAPALLAGTGEEGLLADVAEGTARISVALPPLTPYALDADVARATYLVEGAQLSRAQPGSVLQSVDPARRLHRLIAGEPVAQLDPDRLQGALDQAALACAATLLGSGDRLLAESVAYVGARKQFGRVIGEYQAVKHHLADVRVALDFARPLVHAAAEQLTAGSPHASRDASAAKVAASDAAHRAARTALQVHGAIGYTLEFDLSMWILGIRALVGAWGTPAVHRARVLDALTRS